MLVELLILEEDLLEMELLAFKSMLYHDISYLKKGQKKIEHAAHELNKIRELNSSISLEVSLVWSVIIRVVYLSFSLHG